MKPNFLFIGPDKSGSTWLYHVLRQHPSCYFPAIKDIYFFDKNYHRGWKWYESFFQNAPGDARIVGEFSHDYLFSESAAIRIARDLPEAKLMVCLRNPIERSFSQYLFFVQRGMTRLSFEEAIEKWPRLIDNSMYFKHLSVYFKIFQRSRLGVFLFDALKNDPAGFARQVYDFLGLPFDDTIDYSKRILPAGRPRNYLVAKTIMHSADFARKAGMLTLVGKLKTSRFVQLFYKPYDQSERPELDEETRRRLYNKFKPEIKNLEKLIDMDLTRWHTA